MNTDKIAKAALQFIHATNASTGSRGKNGAIKREAWKNLYEVAGFKQSKKNDKARIKKNKNRIEKYGRSNTKDFFYGLEQLIKESLKEAFNKAA